MLIKRLIHKGAAINELGRVSSWCFKKDRAIDSENTTPKERIAAAQMIFLLSMTTGTKFDKFPEFDVEYSEVKDFIKRTFDLPGGKSDEELAESRRLVAPFGEPFERIAPAHNNPSESMEL